MSIYSRSYTFNTRTRSHAPRSLPTLMLNPRQPTEPHPTTPGNHGNARSSSCGDRLQGSHGYRRNPGGGFGRSHSGHHLRVVLPPYPAKCPRGINVPEQCVTLSGEMEECTPYAPPGEGPDPGGSRRRRCGELEDSVVEAIREAVQAGNHLVITTLMISAPHKQRAILQETISQALLVGKLDFLSSFIDLSGAAEPETWKVAFRDVFRFCQEWREVQTLLRYGLRQKGALLKQWDPCGRTVLQVALVHGDLRLCRDVMAAEPELVDLRNASGQSALHTAVSCGMGGASVEVLLDAGADPDMRTGDGRTALMEAVLCGNEAAVHMLIHHGAEVDAVDRTGFTSLHHAVSRGHLHCVQALLDSGATLCHPTDDEPDDTVTSWTAPSFCRKSVPLALAVKGGHADVVRVLLEAGCDPGQLDRDAGWTALHYAVTECPEPSCLSVLLACPAVDVNALATDGRTALMLAVSFGQCDMVSRLLKHPSLRVGMTDTGSGMSALHRAADAGCHLCTTCLLSAGAPPDAPDHDGATPLLLAVNSRHTHLMWELLLWGRGRWPWNPLSSLDRSVLNIVVKRGYWDIATGLLTAGWSISEFRNRLRSGSGSLNSSSGSLSSSLPRTLTNILTSPPTLKHVCRLRFKACLGLRAPHQINGLPFPSAIKSYLLFTDLSNAILHPVEQ